jgi:16S rRNA C967 or C1407 C5-methylase (RsmB/RsmF family)/NOL1/NOP2/fmu family ribosome biogenesis protein
MMLPEKLLEGLTAAKGFARTAFETVHASGEQVTSIRLNPAKPAGLDGSWNTEPVPWCPYGKYLSERPSFTLDPLLHAGAYYVQEASSMFLWHALQQLTGNDIKKKVLDLCGAPGGKTSLLASYFSQGLVVSNEVIKPRVQVLVENSTKWGSDHVIVTNNDPSHFRSLPGYFDVMVVDAPCSGSGLFRKDPEAIEEWSENNVQLCSQRQQRILADVLPALEEDGLLIYSTCSYSKEEDEDIVDWLLGEMDMESLRISIPAEWGIVETESSLHGGYGYRFYPNLVKGEGFFMAAFRKRSEEADGRLKEQHLLLPTKTELQRLAAFVAIPDAYTVFSSGDTFRALRSEWFRDLRILAQYLYIRKAGTAIGSLKGKDLVPSHELALGTIPLPGIPSIPVDKQEALQYLKRKDLQPATEKGWNLIRYCELPLGWVKVLPNRINNYYPAEWRILKE